jgi:UDPglucose--hexose-1-phosphate uridylyltransferase
MKKTVTQLADGRELIYFDERDDTVRDQPDRRPLGAGPVGAELRYDALVDEWVAIAGHRQERIYLPPDDECPLDPSTATRATEIPATEYDVVIFENRFPAFSERPPSTPPDPATPPTPPGPTAPPTPPGPTRLSPVRTGVGRCEVVCFTSDHDASFATLSEQRVRTVLAALADRTGELSALPDIEQVFPFENRGEEIGVTLRHPHGQIYGYPFLPPRTQAMLAAAGRHRRRTGGVLLADVLAQERDAGVRVVAGNADWTAYVPAAARWPFEVHVVPHRQVLDLAALTDAEAAAFAPVYLDVLRRCDALFGTPLPYVSAWHQAPVRHPDRDLGYLHLQLTSIRRAASRLKYLAGSEAAMGVFVNDIRPETAARMLRESL